MPKRKKKEKKMPVEVPQTESTPIKFWKQDGDEKPNVSLAPHVADFMETLKSIMGVKDTEFSLANSECWGVCAKADV